MDEPRDPSAIPLLTYCWVLGLSILGGIVAFMNKLKDGHARVFNVVEFIGEICASGFVGMITFYLCEASHVTPILSAALVGISGHMGNKALFLLETWATKKFTKL